MEVQILLGFKEAGVYMGWVHLTQVWSCNWFLWKKKSLKEGQLFTRKEKN
jgi:hypothetical protein